MFSVKDQTPLALSLSLFCAGANAQEDPPPSSREAPSHVQKSDNQDPFLDAKMPKALLPKGKVEKESTQPHNSKVLDKDQKSSLVDLIPVLIAAQVFLLLPKLLKQGEKYMPLFTAGAWTINDGLMLGGAILLGNKGAEKLSASWTIASGILFLAIGFNRYWRSRKSDYEKPPKDPLIKACAIISSLGLVCLATTFALGKILPSIPKDTISTLAIYIGSSVSIVAAFPFFVKQAFGKLDDNAKPDKAFKAAVNILPWTMSVAASLICFFSEIAQAKDLFSKGALVILVVACLPSLIGEIVTSTRKAKLSCETKS